MVTTWLLRGGRHGKHTCKKSVVENRLANRGSFHPQSVQATWCFTALQQCSQCTRTSGDTVTLAAT
jgi:hypothetical protein